MWFNFRGGREHSGLPGMGRCLMDVLARESMRQITHGCTLETPHQLGGSKQ